jgi:hypothetical protein
MNRESMKEKVLFSGCPVASARDIGRWEERIYRANKVIFRGSKVGTVIGRVEQVGRGLVRHPCE